MLQAEIQKIKKGFLAKQSQMLILLWLIVVLFLIKQTGYFNPYLEITFLFISFVIWISAVLLLRLSSSFSLGACIIMWIAAMIIVLLGIIPWAERASLYSFGFLLFGSFQMFYELLTQKETDD